LSSVRCNAVGKSTHNASACSSLVNGSYSTIQSCDVVDDDDCIGKKLVILPARCDISLDLIVCADEDIARGWKADTKNRDDAVTTATTRRVHTAACL
jgi:hypothetical protein